MWADGEDMAQMFFLLGTEPVWRSNGRLKGFKVIPLEELGRPRIDLTVRVSGHHPRQLPQLHRHHRRSGTSGGDAR